MELNSINKKGKDNKEFVENFIPSKSINGGLNKVWGLEKIRKIKKQGNAYLAPESICLSAEIDNIVKKNGERNIENYGLCDKSDIFTSFCS